MKRVLIVGGGFAGLAAAAHLKARESGLEVILFDRREANEFRPLLPDMLDRALTASSLCYPLRTACRVRMCRFLPEAVREIEPDNRIVRTDNTEMAYDYLILACGVDSEFHGVESAREHAFCFRDVAHAGALRDELLERPGMPLVVVGAGYTGVEAVTHAWRQDMLKGRRRRLLLVDLADRLCPGTPEIFQQYVARELRRLGIEVRLKTTVRDAGPHAVRLSDGEIIAPALLVWTAGVSPGEPASSMNVPKTRGGRLAVDASLQVADGCFAVGDVAGFERGEELLRMGVQFSLSEGRCAAENVLRLCHGRDTRHFKPVDLGYIIPMGQGRACGIVMGRRVWGRPAMALHYAMCLFRSHGLRRRWRILRGLFRRSSTAISHSESGIA